MIKATTLCTDCIHRHVCKHKDNAIKAGQTLRETNYENETKNWDEMSEQLHIVIEISCPDYE